MKQTLEKMRQNGFRVIALDTRQQAKDFLLSEIEAGTSVGVSGTVSVRQTEVIPALIAKGCTLYSHWDVAPDEVTATRQKANAADVYLTSANAVTKNGELILIDGAGNRVAAVAYGPKRVYFVIGENKWVNGGYGAAVARAKKMACPPNARRQALDTPCAAGECSPQDCGDSCMCRMTLSLDREPRGRKVTVLFVRETLGY